jgi:hypothetical protein
MQVCDRCIQLAPDIDLFSKVFYNSTHFKFIQNIMLADEEAR